MNTKTKVVKDPVTGAPMLDIESEDKGAKPENAGAGDFALFYSESDDKPTATVNEFGVQWRIREMRESEVATHRDFLTAGLAAELGLELEVVNDANRFKEAIKTVPDGTERVLKYRLRASENICQAHIKGWSLDKPCDAAAIRDLVPSVKTKVGSLILEKSLSGRSSDDFLERS